MTPKVYVLDTSTLIEDPEIINPYKAEDYFVVPAVVLRQLDGLKNNPATSYNARKASQYIEQMQAEERLAITDRHIPVNMLNSKADNMIVGTALFTKENVDDYEVCLASTDRNMRIAANYYGVNTAKAIEPKPNYYFGRTGSFGGNGQMRQNKKANNDVKLILVYLAILLVSALPMIFNFNENLYLISKTFLIANIFIVVPILYANSDWRINRILKKEAISKVRRGDFREPRKDNNCYDNWRISSSDYYHVGDTSYYDGVGISDSYHPKKY